MDIAQFGWRDGVLAFAVVAAIYLAFTLLRLSQVGHRNKSGFNNESPLTQGVTPPLNEILPRGEIVASQQTPDAEVNNPMAGEAIDEKSALPAATAKTTSMFQFPSFRRGAPVTADNHAAQSSDTGNMATDAVPLAPTFGDALSARCVEEEVRQLRSEVAALRHEVLELEASRRVSPQYADAMALAQRGYDTRGIADQCGISLGEAELIRALAHGVQDTEAEDVYAGIN